MNQRQISKKKPPGKKSIGNQPSCFIAAPASIDVQTVRSLLLARAIRPITIRDLISEGLAFDEVTDAISNSEIFVALLDIEERNPNVYLEIGYALALGKRM